MKQREHVDARADVRSESGFTLIELMMVVLIIAILIAVLMPTFMGARDRANDRATQTALRNAVTATKAVYVDKQDYAQATPLRLNAEGVPVKFVDGVTAPTEQNSVSIDVWSASYVVISGQSKAGDCFYVSADEGNGSMLYAKLGGAGGCAANGAPLPNDPAWQLEW